LAAHQYEYYKAKGTLHEDEDIHESLASDICRYEEENVAPADRFSPRKKLATKTRTSSTVTSPGKSLMAFAP
jgi:hypothetical protein